VRISDGLLFERKPYCLQHTVEFFANLMVPKSDDCNSFVREELLSPLISHLPTTVVMSTAIQFDRELRSRTVEIECVRINRVLRTELIAREVAVPQMSPKNSLTLSCCFAK